MLTTADVAKLLHLSPRRVRALKERIGFSLIGGMLFFTSEAVEQFKKTRKGK